MRPLTRTIRTSAKSNASNRAPLRKTAAIMGVLVLASIAARADAAPDNMPSDQLAQAQETCETVILVQPGDEHFRGCVSSLMGSLENASREHAVVRARNNCFAQGLKPRSSDLSLCLLQAADSVSRSDVTDQPHQLNMVTGKKEDQASSRYALFASFDTVFERERQACARLGFDPAFGAFANCVADLQGTVQRIEMPTN
jgi:hypothetical protein